MSPGEPTSLPHRVSRGALLRDADGSTSSEPQGRAVISLLLSPTRQPRTRGTRQRVFTRDMVLKCFPVPHHLQRQDPEVSHGEEGHLGAHVRTQRGCGAGGQQGHTDTAGTVRIRRRCPGPERGASRCHRPPSFVRPRPLYRQVPALRTRTTLRVQPGCECGRPGVYPCPGFVVSGGEGRGMPQEHLTTPGVCRHLGPSLCPEPSPSPHTLGFLPADG